MLNKSNHLSEINNSQFPTLTDLSKNPLGITSRKIVAKLLDVHVLTITRWYKTGKFPKPIIIGNSHYFRNSDVLGFLDNQANSESN